MAVWNTLKAVKNSRDAVAFYNCGSRSGASQPHKHMQVIPLESPSPISELVRKVSQRRPGKKENKPGKNQKRAVFDNGRFSRRNKIYMGLGD
jgi:ATP adenylyltransferase